MSMSEKSPEYQVSSVPQTLHAFITRPCSNLWESGDYQPPSPLEIRALRRLMGWSQTDVAKIVGASWNHKGSSSVRKWETATDKPEHRKIPYAAWRLLLLHSGVVELEQCI